MGVLIVLIIVAALATIVFHLQKGGAKGAKSALYQDLLRKARGDAGVVERLIELERKRHPTAPREQLVKFAIDKWERHNR